jgi:hypothetical protein
MSYPIRRAALPLALAAALGAALAPAAIAKRAAPVRVPSTPQVKILGFTTFVRLGIPAIQARPGRTITACYDGYNGQREVNFVWQGFGIPKGTKMGIALWGGSSYGTGSQAEPSDADTMRPDSGGFTWSHKREQKVQVPYGFSFAGGPFGPLNIDGVWTAKVLIKGRVVVRKQVTIACA